MLAVTLRHRRTGDKVSYALITLSAPLSVEDIEEISLTNQLEITELDLETLENSQGQMKSCLRQHAEQLRHRDTEGVLKKLEGSEQRELAPELAVNLTRPIIRLAVDMVTGALLCASTDGTVCCLELALAIAKRQIRWFHCEHTASVHAICTTAGIVYTAAGDATVRSAPI